MNDGKIPTGSGENGPFPAGQPRQLPTEIVREVIWSAAGTNAILVGGQALGVWVDLLLDPDFIDALGGPVTSKDIDFFGNVEVANELAKRLDGRVVIPGPDHVNTPEAAIVLYDRRGVSYQIDILGRLAGLTEREINDGWVEIPHGDGEDEIVVRVLAPSKSSEAGSRTLSFCAGTIRGLSDSSGYRRRSSGPISGSSLMHRSILRSWATRSG